MHQCLICAMLHVAVDYGVGSFVFFFKQKTAYEMRISDWSSDVCSSDLAVIAMTMGTRLLAAVLPVVLVGNGAGRGQSLVAAPVAGGDPLPGHALDVAQQAALVLGAEGNCLAVPAGKIGRAPCRERVCQYV